MQEELDCKLSIRIAYASVSQGLYLTDAKIFNIYYNRFLRVVSFTRFVFALFLAPAGAEVIIGNSKILEFKYLRYILRFSPQKNISYINDFYLDNISHILTLKAYGIVNKIYMLNKSDEEIEIIKNYFHTDVTIQPISTRNEQKLENCSVISVKPILQFPAKYWPTVYWYLVQVKNKQTIDFITFHPRVGKLERRIYLKLFYFSSEVNANFTEFKNTKFYGFYSSFMIGGEENFLSLIRFDKHRPYEEFLNRINQK